DHIQFNFNQPTDLAIAPNGDIYVAEGYGGNMVHQFDRNGKFIRTIGRPGKAPGEFNTPHGIWIDTRKGEPEVYVADRTNGRVQVFTLNGTLKRTIADGIVRNPCCFHPYKGKMFIPDLDHRRPGLGRSLALPIPVRFQPAESKSLPQIVAGGFSI